MRTLNLVAAAAVTMLAMTGVAGCGTQSAGSSGAAGGAPSAAKVSLVIRLNGSNGFMPAGSVGPGRWTLTCDPAGGSLPDPAAACRQLLPGRHPFAAIPSGHACPMIVVGTQTARITGTWYDRKINLRLVHGGCDLLRWNKLDHVLR